MKNNTLMTLILVVVVGAAGFFGGMQYQKSQGGQAGALGQNGQFRGGIRNGTNRPVIGNILSVDAQSMTVKLQDGSTKIVLLSSSTTIGKMTAGSASDLKVGDRVGAYGTTNADGSMTAQSVQLNPTFGGGRGMMSPSPVPTQ